MKRTRVKGVICWGCLNVIEGIMYVFRHGKVYLCESCLEDTYRFAVAVCDSKCDSRKCDSDNLLER